jgi:hypothetical protein
VLDRAFGAVRATASTDRYGARLTLRRDMTSVTGTVRRRPTFTA